jgi:hypothetical protein
MAALRPAAAPATVPASVPAAQPRAAATVGGGPTKMDIDSKAPAPAAPAAVAAAAAAVAGASTQPMVVSGSLRAFAQEKYPHLHTYYPHTDFFNGTAGSVPAALASSHGGGGGAGSTATAAAAAVASRKRLMDDDWSTAHYERQSADRYLRDGTSILCSAVAPKEQMVIAGSRAGQIAVWSLVSSEPIRHTRDREGGTLSGLVVAPFCCACRPRACLQRWCPRLS